MPHEVKLKQKRRGQPDSEDESAVNLQRASTLMSWVVGVVALLVYMATMTPGMQMGDGTELAAAAHVMGVPHPTGYPLYMMLTKLWLVLTMGGEVITRTTLLNCIIMAAAAGLTSLITLDLLRVVWRAAVSKPMLWAAGLMGLLTAFLRFHWENAVVTEVYALQFLLTLIFVRIVQRMNLAGGPSPRSLLALTIIFALAMAHHRLSVTLILPYLATWFWAWHRSRSGSGLRITKNIAALAGLILVAGASLYLYIPLRAAQQPPINWGNVTTASAFYNHVRGTEYLDRGLLKPGLGQQFTAGYFANFFTLQTRQILSDSIRQWADPGVTETLVPGPPGSQKVFFVGPGFTVFQGLIFVLLSAWGFYCGWKSDPRIRKFILVVGVIAAQNLAVIYAYNIADIRDYYLFPFWAMVIGIFMLNPRQVSLTFESKNQRGLPWFLAFAVFVIAFINYPRANRSNDLSAELLSATILPDSTEIMPPGSILITDDDAETFTTWYRQKVRGDRLDVLNFAGNFVYMPWYEAFFTPDQRSRYNISLAPGVALSATEYTHQLRDAIIDSNVEAHPIFTSINDPPVLMTLSQTYDVVPVDAVEVIHPLYDELTTTVLYRISPKDTPAQ